MLVLWNVKLFHILIITANFYNTKKKNRIKLLIFKVNSNTTLDSLIINYYKSKKKYEHVNKLLTLVN